MQAGPAEDGALTTIEIQRLTKRYGRVTAVADLSFAARPGRVTGFLGPNGAGKTTTLRVLLGLARPDAGRATFDGAAYRDLAAPLRTVGALLEGAGLHPGRSGRDHLRVLATAGGLPSGRVDALLELVALGEVAHRRAGGYSLGMRQRLGLAAALLGDPPCLVLDEPANGLDPQGVRWLRDFLRARAGEGRTVLVSSHVLAEVAQTVDDVVVVHHGRLVAATTLEDLLARAGRRVRVRADDPARLRAVLATAGLAVRPGPDGSLEVPRASGGQVGAAARRAGVSLSELTEVGSSLEEVFLQLTARPEGS